MRDVPDGDKRWLQEEAELLGVSMEGLVRVLIRAERERRREKPSVTLRRLFGVRHGVELALRRYPYRPPRGRLIGGA